MKRLALLLVMMIVLSSADACTDQAGQTNEPSGEAAETTAEKTRIEVWSWWGSEARMPVITHIIDYFNENSDTTYAEYVYTPYGDIFTKNLASIAAGNPANVMFGALESARFRAAESQVENLKPFMDRDNFPLSQYADLYASSVEYEDGIYGLPFVVETRMVYFNKDHFDEIGVDYSNPDNLPKTWDELVTLSRELDIKNGSSYDRLGFLPLFGNGGWSLWMTNADNGLGFYDGANDSVSINTPQKLDVINRVMSIHDYYGDDVINEVSTAQSAGMQNVFGSGIVSMAVNNTTYARELNTDFPDLNWGTFPIPEYEEGSGHYSNGGGFVIEMPMGAPDQENSWEFIKYMGSAYAQKYWSVNCFELSALLELADDPELTSDPVYSTALEMAKTTTCTLTPNDLNGFMDVLNSHLDQVRARTVAPEDALIAAQKEVEELRIRQGN